MVMSKKTRGFDMVAVCRGAGGARGCCVEEERRRGDVMREGGLGFGVGLASQRVTAGQATRVWGGNTTLNARV